ncbi:beta-aspartyl-peptidase, partial [Streptomyces sp. ISL-11]|nr:beta-aspartyl-peptidase [Streptomyces sp. ISL-11]
MRARSRGWIVPALALLVAVVTVLPGFARGDAGAGEAVSAAGRAGGPASREPGARDVVLAVHGG